ncbi:hypothetical protein BELL_0166g00120 [Botrytis elliptica]|uniref:VIT domain-containing protein n=1 Tax=Botrytis elliptica TaxID=278938 RepID=A0A4Z1K4G4_9HELO|nr:hypothetical protein EAE99_009814 [Botrytis elliptica]TGO76253.1 hypothetical protein BELL_0166g00120 [Botrytis elliptica]
MLATSPAFESENTDGLKLLPLSTLSSSALHIHSPEFKKHIHKVLSRIKCLSTTIVSETFKTILKQTFVNSVKLEDGQLCAYRFPIYDRVSVVGFKCRIGSDCLFGFIKERKQAEIIYDTMVAKGDTAGIIVQVPEGPNFFLTRIGHVPFGERVHVEITYVGELKQDIGCMRFRISAWITHCYGLNSSAKHPSTVEPVTSSIDYITGEINITVDIILPERKLIKRVQSLSHMVTVSTGAISTAAQEVSLMNMASMTLSNMPTDLEKDFALIIQANDVEAPYVRLEARPIIPSHRALLVSLVPPCPAPNSPPLSTSEIVFVANLSINMKTDIPMLVSALKVFLKSLPTNFKFNILSLGNRNDFLWSQSKDYNNETLQEAMQYLETLDAGYGPREPFEAIQATIENRIAEIPLEIILLTGAISFTGKKVRYLEPLLHYFDEQVDKSQGNIRVFCFGIGNPAAHGLLKESLEQGVDFFGVYRVTWNAVLDFRYDEDDGFKLIDKVTEKSEVLRSEHERSSTSFSSVPGPNNKDTDTSETFYPQIIQAPHIMPGLFAEIRTTVYLLICPRITQRNPVPIILRHSQSDRLPILEIPVPVLTEKVPTIHQLAARKAIQEIE